MKWHLFKELNKNERIACLLGALSLIMIIISGNKCGLLGMFTFGITMCLDIAHIEQFKQTLFDCV